MRTIELERMLDMEYMSIVIITGAVILMMIIVMAVTIDVIDYVGDMKNKETLKRYQEALQDKNFLVSRYGNTNPRVVLDLNPEELIRIYDTYRRSHDRETIKTGQSDQRL